MQTLDRLLAPRGRSAAGFEGETHGYPAAVREALRLRRRVVIAECEGDPEGAAIYRGMLLEASRSSS